MIYKVTALVTYEIGDTDNAQSAIDVFNYIIQPPREMQDVFLTAVTIQEAKQERELF